MKFADSGVKEPTRDRISHDGDPLSLWSALSECKCGSESAGGGEHAKEERSDERLFVKSDSPKSCQVLAEVMVNTFDGAALFVQGSCPRFPFTETSVTESPFFPVVLPSNSFTFCGFGFSSNFMGNDNL